MLKIKGLKKNYDRFALDCSLEVKAGCVTGLIGQNGAGKSTTFKAALGLIFPEDGEVQVFGKPVSKLNREDKEKIGAVLSDSGFSGYLTIKDIVSVMEGLYKKFDKTNFLSKCEQFHLPTDKKIKEFSTGMKAKLKVLVAISHEASLLILDEPTAGLDVLVRDEVLEMLREFMEEKEERAILISSHISGDLESICDELYMIHDGRIIFQEATDVLLSDYAVLKVSAEQMKKLDQRYLLKKKKEGYGYSCLTDQRQFYLDNYGEAVVERGTIDELITMMVKGEDL